MKYPPYEYADWTSRVAKLLGGHVSLSWARMGVVVFCSTVRWLISGVAGLERLERLGASGEE